MAIFFLNKGPVDPFQNPVLCPTDSGSIRGARFGCSRIVGGTLTWHGAIDLKAAEGTEFKSIYSGKVTLFRNLLPSDPNYKRGVGNFVIKKSDDFSIKYCHFSKINVAICDTVSAGATLGKTGNAFKGLFKHLHVEVSIDYIVTQNHYGAPEPYLKTKYNAYSSVAGVGDIPQNPNSSNHTDCRAFALEETQELEMTKAVGEKLFDRSSWNSSTTAHYKGGQGMYYRVKNINILGTTITIDSNLNGSRSLIISTLTTVDIRSSSLGVEPLEWKFDISTYSDAFIVKWELFSTWVPTTVEESK